MNPPTLLELLDSATALEPLNGTAQKVIALTEDEHFSAQQLAALVGSEPVLATRMLRIANSAYYGAPRRIASVREAIVLIGFRAVRSTVTAMCLIERCPRPIEIDGPRFWRHALSVATLAEGLGRRAGGNEAFTAGIVHNIGRLALAQYAPQAFRETVAHARSESMAVHEAQRVLLGYTDADLGAALGTRWQLPDVLTEAFGSSIPPAPVGPVAHVVFEARAVVASLGVTDGVDGPVASDDTSTPPEGWERLLKRVDTLVGQLVPV